MDNKVREVRNGNFGQIKLVLNPHPNSKQLSGRGGRFLLVSGNTGTTTKRNCSGRNY